jgi:arylsulfatase A-like enzyme
MGESLSQLEKARPGRAYLRAAYALLAPRAYTVIIFGALFCNLAVKFFHAVRYGLLSEYPSWIFTDVAVLVTIEAALALICYLRPSKGILRGVTIFAAALCTWSVINAGWLIRTGTQILPMEINPLVRDPLNIARMVLVNLLAMPGMAVILLAPSAVALAFFFAVLARPQRPNYDRRRFRLRIAASLIVSGLAAGANAGVSSLGSQPVAAAGLRFNCQSRAVLSFVLSDYRNLARADFRNATRELPRGDEIPIAFRTPRVNHNIVLVVLEGVQYDCTSLAAAQGGTAPQGGADESGPTPYLTTLAAQGACFTNVRSIVTHTTKALFALLTGRTPSASQDIAEAVPVKRPYASLATILEKGLGFRTAFFQSATGTFESRPGLVHNLGFQKFWAREDLNDPNQFIGYLGCDEFAMLRPISDWITSEDKPFFLVVLCSVTHDPYDVPAWFGPLPREVQEKYQQAVTYTDRFLAALDAQLANLNLVDNTIFCVIGDHGECFSEHGMMGHERIAYEEVLRVAWCLRAPFLVEPGTRVTEPVGSVDLAPTLLGLLGFDIERMHFDGLNALRPLPQGRKVYFSGWMQQGPAGFVQQDRKYVYDPVQRGSVMLYRLNADPLELSGLELPPGEAQRLSTEIINWRKSSIFRLDQAESGHTTLYDAWLCKWWNGRESKVKREEGK